MKKNIFKKLFVLFTFVSVLISFNFVLAEEIIPDIVLQEVDTDPIPDPIVLNENIFIRNNDNVIYDSIVNLPDSGVVSVLDNSGESHEINKQSVLGLLYSISQDINAPFVISNLQYYPSMNAFYLKCITPTGGVELCDNWQYVVGGVTPWTGIDQTLLSGNESIGLYFGTPHKLILEKNEIFEGESIVVNSKKYNYFDNTWDILNNINISITIPNENDPWNPTVISEIVVDENGVANITLDNEGTYTIGIKEDYSFPSYQVVVKKRSTGGGGSGGGNSGAIFSMDNAISFLTSNRNNFWNDLLYVDWVAIGIAQSGNGTENLRNDIMEYYKNEEFDLSVITDIERHSMALMALGINPYTDTNVNYINKIINSFDGNQIGDKNLYNDDIFGLIVLSHAGYTKNDNIISKVVEYVISKQSSDGSWGSIDMTSAAIGALSNFKKLSGVNASIANGELYLKNNQNTDGGFENSFSTSWAVQAMSLDNSLSVEVDRAINYLSTKQQIDGGVSDNDDIKSRIWATSYSVPAVLKLSWNDILESFDKENIDGSEDYYLEDQNTTEVIEEEKIEDVKVKDNDIIPEEIKQEKKILNIKKENVLNLQTEDKQKIELNNNLLSASAIGQDQNTNMFFSSIYKILNKIKAPFVWLFIHLGF